MPAQTGRGIYPGAFGASAADPDPDHIWNAYSESHACGDPGELPGDLPEMCSCGGGSGEEDAAGGAGRGDWFSDGTFRRCGIPPGGTQGKYTEGPCGSDLLQRDRDLPSDGVQAGENL